QRRIRLAIFGCRQVVIARAFIAQRTVDHDEIRRSLHVSNLPSRRDADEKTTPGGEKLLGDQDGKGGSDRATNDAAFVPLLAKDVQVGVVAGPAVVAAGAFGGAQIAHDVAVRIENTDFRNSDVWELLLPTRLSQQTLGRESRRCLVVFVPKDR